MTLEKPAGTAASKVGTYELLKEQPGISVGTTWVARSTREGAPPAEADATKLFSVVRVHKHLTKKPEVTEALVADTLVALGFQHPNALALVGVGNEAGEIFVATQHHEGETLAALVATAGAQGLPQPVVLRIALDVLAGLAAAHEQDPPLYHGEIGPQHIQVGDDGQARLSGLVSARCLSRIAPPLGAKNHDRLSYAAPERVKGMAAGTGPALDARADVFSMGVILWEGLSHQRLFTSKIEAAIVQKVLTAPIAALGGLSETMGAPPGPPQVGAPGSAPKPPVITVPAPLAEAVHKALERDPAKRTQSVKELLAALEALGADAAASHKQVADEVEKLAGKAIAVRKTEIRAEITRRSSKASSTIPPPAAAKPAGPVRGKATLLGIASPLASPKPPTVKPVEAKPAEVKPAEAKPAEVKPPTVKPVEAKPVEVKPARPPAESLNLEEIEVAAPVAPPPPPKVNKRGVTMMMGAPAPPPPPAVKETPAVEKPPGSSPKPAPVQPLPDNASVKTAHTPGTDGPSSRSKSGLAIEKVGPGSTLGRYEILMPVARGGMASVWAAKLPGSRGFQKIFAIKTMLPDVSDDPEFESMFLDEGRVAARIRHPNVVEIIDLGEQDDVLYLVMEWVEGENLGSLVKAARAHGGVPLPIILRLASQVCAGLHAAHELRDDDGNLLDLVHRDISPANVLVSTSGFVKIVDFGIAKSKGRLHVTRVSGTVKGKTPYLSPEQLGQLAVDRRSDIFSFGVLLYVLATGLHPFRGETDTKTIENIALREPVPLRALVATTPPEFEALVLKALAKEPKDRFSTAGEVQRALDQIAGSLGLTTTEEDVAAFVRKALGETLSKRAQDLRAAVDRADGKTPAPPAETPAAASGETAKPAEKPTANEVAETVRPLPIMSVEAAPENAKDAAVAISAKPPETSAEVVEKAIEEDVSFEGAAAVVPKLGADLLPRPKQPQAETLPEIFPPPGEEHGPTEATSPPVTRSPSEADTDDVPVDVGVPPKRKPVVMLAVGAALALCAVVGVVAVFSGGGKKSTATTPAVTATAVATTPTPTVQTAAPTTAPEPPPAPQATTATPVAPAPAPAPEAAPVADAPVQAATPPPAATAAHGTATKGTPPSKPTPPVKTRPKKPYNPGTL